MTTTPAARRWHAALELSPERISRRTSTFGAAGGERRRLVTSIGQQFAEGYNATLRTWTAAPAVDRVRAGGDDFLTPFYVEGAAMALGLGRLLAPRRARSAHRALLTDLPEHRYLVLAGWGWAHAVLPFPASTIRRSAIWRTGGLLSGLGIDGLAFATCFLRADPTHFDLSCPFPEPEFAALWRQGYGRALWFTSGESPTIFRRQLDRLAPDQRPDLCAGFGLASAFAGLRGLGARPTPPTGDARERAAFDQGVAFGLTARHQASPHSYRAAVAGWPAADRAWADAAVELCGRQPEPDPTRRDAGYLRWQGRVRRELAMQGSPR